MQTVTITLDGVEVSGFSGMTILQLAQETGVEIPTLCHDPRLSPHGACRLCLVEDESTKALVASCATPIRSGMIINTRSPRVVDRRKTIVQLMLASHPDSCLVCDKGNRCQLRKIASDMGIGHVKFQRLPLTSKLEEINSFILRDPSKCILCGKCIRVDQELVVEGAIDYMERGFLARPATLGDMPLEKSECTFCGVCVAVCPVGALTEKEKPYTGTTSKVVETTCGYCGCGCRINIEVKDNQVLRVTPADGLANHGALCIRGSYGFDYIHSPDRLTRPLVRKEQGFEPASWDEALDHVVAELARINDSYGSDSLAVLGSSKCTNEENYLIQRLARAVLGTNNLDNGSSLYSRASLIGLGQTTGFPASTNSLDDLEKSDLIFIIGTNPSAYAPVVSYAVKRAVKVRGARLIVVDPRKTGLTSSAHLWLRPRIGTDISLIGAMARLIIDEGLYDQEFVNRRTDNFGTMVENLAVFTPEYASDTTGIPAEQIRLAARLFGGAERAAVVFGDGICRHPGGEDCVKALANLVMLTGEVGQKNGGLYALKQDSNAQGACDMGMLPDFLPGYRDIEDAQARKIFEDRWGCTLSGSPGSGVTQMMQNIVDGNIKGMIVIGENPAVSLPDSSTIRKALASLEFLLVIDIFPTQTAELAHVVLPAAGFAEKTGTFTNFEGRPQPVRKAVNSPGESLADFEILLRLAERLGHKMPYSSPEQVMEEITETVPLYHGSPTAIRDIDESENEPISDVPPSTRLYGGIFPSTFGRFIPLPASQVEEEFDEEFPLTLITGTVPSRFGSGTRTAKVSRLQNFLPQSWLEIGRRDADSFGIKGDEKVKVISHFGELTTKVVITDTLPEGTVFMPRSFPETPVNELLETMKYPDRTASVGKCTVRLERMVDDD